MDVYCVVSVWLMMKDPLERSYQFASFSHSLNNFCFVLIVPVGEKWFLHSAGLKGHIIYTWREMSTVEEDAGREGVNLILSHGSDLIQL